MKTIKKAACSLALLIALASPALAGIMDIPDEPPACNSQQTPCLAQSADQSTATESADTSTSAVVVTYQIIATTVQTFLGL